MLCYDMLNFIIYIQNLPRYTQEKIIMVLQIILIIAEIIYFFYLRNYFNQEEKRILKNYYK